RLFRRFAAHMFGQPGIGSFLLWVLSTWDIELLPKEPSEPRERKDRTKQCEEKRSLSCCNPPAKSPGCLFIGADVRLTCWRSHTLRQAHNATSVSVRAPHAAYSRAWLRHGTAHACGVSPSRAPGGRS